MFAPHSPRQNRLLAALPAAVAERLRPSLKLVPMASGDVLFEAGSPPRHIFFPTTATVSFPCVDDGETTLVGSEGVVGVALFLAGAIAPGRGVVERTGFGYRLPSLVFLAEFNRGGPLMHVVLHYAQALLSQMAQTAFCNHHHTLEQQFCRQLLICLDRLGESAMATRHGWIPGLGNEGVAEIAEKLQRAGLVECRDERIALLDRPALERRACECYAVVRAAFERQLPYPLARTGWAAGRHERTLSWEAHADSPDFIDARKRQ